MGGPPEHHRCFDGDGKQWNQDGPAAHIQGFEAWDEDSR